MEAKKLTVLLQKKPQNNKRSIKHENPRFTIIDIAATSRLTKGISAGGENKKT